MTWLTPAQVADQLGVPRRKILAAIRTKSLPAVNIGAGRPYYRIHQADLDSWIRARRTVDTNHPAHAH